MSQTQWQFLSNAASQGVTELDLLDLASRNQGGVVAAGGGNVTADVNNADTAAVGTDAQSLISAVLADYGLQSLGTWAWDEITSGASSQQILVDMYQTPQFQQRFPAIAERAKKGLPTLSPSDYVNYEDSLAQTESQFGLPKGALTNQSTVTELLANDVSTSEVTARVQQGYQAVAYAPPEVRQAFSQMFGVSGDGALASYFLDEKRTLPLLEQQATAAQIGGQAGMAGIAVSTEDAMRLAQQGITPSQAEGTITQLNKESPLFQASATEKQGLTAGAQGMEAAFGLNPNAEQEVTNRQQAREAQFSGGGQAYSDTHGIEGAGQAHPF